MASASAVPSRNAVAYLTISSYCRLIMAGALRVEAGRQVLVGVAVAVRACHPHLLAAQLVAQGFEGANSVGDAVDARAPLRVLVHDCIAPQRADDAVQWHV